MPLCDLPSLQRKLIELIAKGMSVSKAMEFVKTEATIKSDSETLDKLGFLTKVDKNPLTEDEKKELVTIFYELTDIIDEAFLTSDNVKGSIGRVIRNALGDEKAIKFFDLLKKRGVELDGEKSFATAAINRRNHIEYLEKLVKVHEAAGDEDIVADLQEKIIIEEERLKKREENVESLLNQSQGLLEKEFILENFIYIAQLIEESGKTSTVIDADSKVEAKQQEIKAKELDIRLLEGKIAALESKIILTKDKAKKKSFKDEKDKAKKDRKEAVKQLGKLNSELKKALTSLSIASLKDITGIDMTKRAESLTKFKFNLEKELNKVQARMMELGLTSLVRDVRDVSMTSQQMIINQRKLMTIATEGMNLRLSYLNNEIERSGAVVVSQVEEMFGEFAVKTVIGKREKLEDGKTEDLSPMNEAEVKEASQIWRNQLLSSYDGSFFTEDPALLTEEALNTLKSFAVGRGVVDASSPEAIDPTFAPSLTADQVAVHPDNNRGTIPAKNRVKSHREAARVIEGSVRRLRSVFGFKYFNGTINEKLLRQVLGDRLMDIHPEAFQKAYLKTMQRRVISQVGIDDKLSMSRNLIKLHGGDPETMPDFADGFDKDNSKLITIDIETFGDVNDPDRKVDGIYSIQIATYDSSNPAALTRSNEVLVNNGTDLVDVKTTEAKERQVLTNDQVTSVLKRIEELQNMGYKLITHNGNGFDLPQLRFFTSDSDLLARVSLRSFDLLANITSQAPGINMFEKSRVKGKKLKELAKNNLPTRTPVLSYPDPTTGKPRIQFTTGYPVNLVTGEEIKLGEGGITELWRRGQETGDFFEFDAYAENDTETTLALFLHMSDPGISSLALQGSDSDEVTTISITPPKSNLLLNNSIEFTGLIPLDTLSDITKITPKVTDIVEQTYMVSSYGYDANAVYDILINWYLKSLMGDPTTNEAKINAVINGLEGRAAEETNFDRSLRRIALENQRAINPLLDELFTKYGFVLSLNYNINDRNEAVVSINDNLDGSMPVGKFKQDGLFSNSVRSAERYENAVLDSFIKFISKSEVKNRFNKAMLDRVKAEPRKETESESQYWERVILDYFKPFVPGLSALQDFGNGSLDWKPADEVGIAFAQVMMDQKPDISVTDVLLQRGNEVESVMQMDDRTLLARGGKGRRKIFGMPSKDKVNMAQPHSLDNEELAYEGWRLQQRVNAILDMDLSDPAVLSSVYSWLETPLTQKPGDPISFFARQQVLDISPDVTVRSPFAAIPNLAERRLLVEEHLYEIPRLLMSFNHDCTYMGMKAPPRFFKDTQPVFYMQDFISAGGPTAAALMGGAVDQLAHMISYGLMTPDGVKELENVLDRGMEILRTNGDAAWNTSNKSDYKYNGKHNILAMLIAFNDGNFKVMDDLLQVLKATDETGAPATFAGKKVVVAGKDLGDPRFMFIDILLGTSDKNSPYFGTNMLNEMATNPSKFNITPADAELAKALRAKMGDPSDEKNRAQLKEFLKGAVTPAFYQAGYPGILQGLQTKVKETNLDLTEDEIEFLARMSVRSQLIGSSRLIDEVIGFSRENIQDLRNILLSNAQRLNSSTYSSTLNGSKALGEARSRMERLGSMQEFISVSAKETAKSVARVRGIVNPSNRKLEEIEQEIESELLTKWKARLDKAAAIWEGKAVDSMSPEEYATFIYEMNVALAGGEEAAQNHLMIYALNRRATTPFVLDEDVADIHRFVMGVHIDKEDYTRYLNREVYFRYGVETASGRNHMVSWYGLGPESSKYAQPRVMEPGGDYNPYGMWKIEEKQAARADFEQIFARQILLNLAKFYRPTIVTGYKPEINENRTKYFLDLQARSAKEIEAAEVSKYLEKAPKIRKYTVGGIEITAKERNDRNKKAAGTAYARLRFRTLASDAVSSREEIILDPTVDGYGALRPAYADIDFTQRGIYALAAAQHAARIKQNQALQQLAEVEGALSSNPNGFVPESLRGYKSPYEPQNMPMIPQSSDDVIGAIALGQKERVEQNAIRLQNVLTEFAKLHGLDESLEAKDWGRIFAVMQLRNKALNPAIDTLQKASQSKTSIDEVLEKDELVREARIRYIDGFLRTAGISSATLSGLKRFSPLDLMATLEERTLSLDTINDIKATFGEEPGWLQVLTYLGTRGKIERLMSMEFGITLDPGVIVRGRQGRAGIPSTTQIPVVAFGREVMQLYQVIGASETAKQVATKMIVGTPYETDPNVKYDSNGFVILESLDPRTDSALYKKIWNATLLEKQSIAEELLKNFYFAVNSENRVTLRDKNNKVFREDEQLEKLTVQGPTDPYAQITSQVDNPSTLWLNTPQGLIQMLNNLENYKLFSEIELAIQTNKEIYGFKTEIDSVIQEKEAQMFERMRDMEDELSESIAFLYETDPGTVKPAMLKDYRRVNIDGKSKDVLDLGYYLRSSGDNPATITITIPNSDTTIVAGRAFKTVKQQKINISVADAPFLTVLTEVLVKAQQLGFEDKASQIGDFIVWANNNKTQLPKSVKSPNALIKIAAMMYKVAGNDAAERSVYRYFNAEGLKTSQKQQIDDVVSALMYVMDNEPHDNAKEYYVTRAAMERVVAEPRNLTSDAVFVRAMATASGKELTPAVVSNIRAAVEDFTRPQLEPEIADEIYSDASSPAVYTDPDDFIMSFSNPAHRESAEKFVNYLDGLVSGGVISARARDMKLMLIGNLAKHNPDIVEELTIESFAGEGKDGIMFAAKRNGRYVIGQNITAMKVTAENEILFRFAEELVHIARLKYVKTNSPEWRKVTGLFDTTRSKPVIREMLLAMNNGKPYENLEQEVEYALSNTDEFFAHMGAFFLLRNVLGSKEAITKLRDKYAPVGRAYRLWENAFYAIKKMAQRVLITFNKLNDNPEYSSFMKEAEDVVMAVIGTGMSTRADVGNPDAQLNAFKRVVATENNRQLTPTEMADLNILISELRVEEQNYKIESSKPIPNMATLAAIDSKINDLKQKIREKDINTFMNISVGFVARTLADLDDFSTTKGSRLTERDLLDNGFRRAFLVGLIQRGIDRRGERADEGTAAGIIRSIPFVGSELMISTILQNNLLQGFMNATSLTYNSPFAPLAILTELIDQASVTTKGSLQSDVSGIQNDKLLIDPYVYNVMIKSADLSSEYPNNLNMQHAIIQDVVRNLLGIRPILTGVKEQKHVESLTGAFRLLTDKTVELQTQVGMLEKTSKNDVFPVRLRDTSLLQDRNLARDAFDIIKKELVSKNIAMLDANGKYATFSPLLGYTSGIIPLNPEEMLVADEASLSKVVADIISGKDTIANGGREAIINWAVRTAAKKSIGRTGITTVADYASTQSLVRIHKDVQEIIHKILWQTRDGDVTLEKTFGGMTTQNMDMVVLAFKKAFLIPTDEKTAERWNTKFQRDDVRKHFSISDRNMPHGLTGEMTGILGPSDVLTIEFLNRVTKSSALFKQDSVFLTSRDVFLSTNPNMLKLFETNLSTLAKGTGKIAYDAIERKMVQQLSGIPNAYFNISQILDMFEAENDQTVNSNSRNITLFDQRGERNLKIDNNALMRQGINRLRLALLETKGNLVRDTTDMGQSLADWNNRAKTLVLMRFGMNINTATYMVEGVMSTMSQMFQESNPFVGVISSFRFLRDMVEDGIVNAANAIVDTSGFPGKVTDASGRTKRQFFPIRQRKIRRLAQNTLSFVEETTSPMLPSNLLSMDPSSDLIEKLGFWDRWKLNRSRSNSSAMKSVRVAMDAAGNRLIVKLERMGHLNRFRDAYRAAAIKPTTVGQIKELLRQNKLGFIDQEVAVYIIQSGLLEGKRLEALRYIRTEKNTFRGVILFQDMMDVELELKDSTSPRSTGPVPRPFLTRNELLAELSLAKTAMAKFQEFNTTRGMVVRKALDAPRSDNLATDLLTFYKSYTSLFVAQQIIRRGSTASFPKMGMMLATSSLLDFTYNLVLALARGTLSYEDILEKLNRKDNISEIGRYIMRNPAFSNNILGLIANASLAAATGRSQGGMLSSVAEAGLMQQFRDIYKMVEAFASPQETWDAKTWAAYKALGPWLIANGYSLPIRVAVAQAWGTSSPTSGGSYRGAKGDISAIIDSMSTPVEDTTNALIREMFPEYPTVLQKETQYNNIPKRHLEEYLKRSSERLQQPQLPQPKQPQLPQPQQPQLPQPQPQQPQPQQTSTSVDLQKANQPIQAPEALL